MTEDQPTPAEALAAIERSRRVVQTRIGAGGWRYDLTYAFIVAAMVGGQAFDFPSNVLASAGGVLGLAVIFQRETRRTGVRVTGVSPRHARWVAIALGVLYASVLLGLVTLRRLSPDLPIALMSGAAAAVTFLVALIGSRLWRRVYRAESGEIA